MNVCPRCKKLDVTDEVQTWFLCDSCNQELEIRTLEDAQLEIEGLRDKLEEAQAELKSTKEVLDSTESIRRVCVNKTHRITNLLRSALPKDAQIGSGAEDMVKSLLAYVSKNLLEENDKKG